MAHNNAQLSALIRNELEAYRNDYHDFNPSVTPTLPYPTAVDFSRQVSRGTPCVYDLDKANLHTWPAWFWTQDRLLAQVTEPLEVAVTPNGNADSLIPGPEGHMLFVEPAVVQLTLKQLLSRLGLASSTSGRTAAFYLQSQNSNLTSTPLSRLLKDLPSNFDFAEAVLGEPDARNLWIGDERSVTSIHRDPYENLYLVLKGKKTFRLWAPVDEVAMPTVAVPKARYVYTDASDGSAFQIETDNSPDRIPWVTLDPLCSPSDQDATLHTSLMSTMHEVNVEEGQILYLPSGWYHHVTQKSGTWKDGSQAPCIAANFWYDMEYQGERYVSRQLVSRMVKMAGHLNTIPPT
jgi:peptidyl-lysine (3S)-dioxygenase / protease